MTAAREAEDLPREMPPLDEPAKSVDAYGLPSPRQELPHIVIYSHSGLMYWWPVWSYGYICAAVTWSLGRPFATDNGAQVLIYPGPGLGLSFLAVILMTLVITSARLRGIYSVVALLSVGLVVVTLSWTGLLDNLGNLVPQLSVFMNAGFYLVLSSALLIIWLVSFFFFDRLTFWRVRPGQLIQESLIGHSEESFDTRGMLFEKHGEDFLRHRLLGLGSGDLKLTIAGAKKRTIDIPDVLFVDRTVEHVQRLIAVEPDQFYT